MLRFFCLIVLLFAGSAGAFGQVAPGAPAMAAQPAPPAAANAPDSTPPPGAPNLVRLQYPNSDVGDVLRLYEQLTGKQLVMDNFVQGKVTIFLSKDVPREEAVKIIEMNLLMNGFSLVPAGGDLVKVIGTGKNPRAAGVPIISDESAIPAGDHVVSYLFKLRYADATELQQVLNQYLQPAQPYTSILPLPKASAVLVTENSSVIRSLTSIVNQIDVPPAEVVSEFIKLERADAQKVVDMLKEIFEKGQSSNVQPAGPGGVRPVRVAVPQQVQGEGDLGSLTALSEEAVVVGKIKITPDVRTNRIHVVTRPINMPFIRKLIGEFDANVEFAKPVTRPLKYVSAADMLPVIVQALSEPGADSRGAEAGGPAGAQQQQQQRQQGRTGTGMSTNSTGALGGSSDSGGGLNVSEELSTTAVDTTPKAVTIGNAKIIADQRANTIIMLGNKEVVFKVQKILDEMDVRAPQVALSTVIGELTLNNTEEFGVDYFLRLGQRAGQTTLNGTGAPLPGAVPAATASSGGTINPGGFFRPGALGTFTQLANAATQGTNIYLAAGSTLSSIVHVLDSTGRFKVISRPMVFTSNNKKAIIASGQEIPVPTSTLTNGINSVNGVNDVASIASNVQFKKVALQLEVVPLINSDKEVSLDILQKLDSLTGQTTSVGGNQIPSISTRYIRTTVSAPNGAVIVLGGLITDNKRRSYTGIPILDKIPLVGALFRNTSNIKERAELIVLMRPEVTLTKLDMYRLRVKNEQKTHLGAEIGEEEAITPEAGGKEEMQPPDLPPEKP